MTNIYQKKSESVNIIFAIQFTIYINQEVDKMLNESVINILKNGMWDLATCADGEPNVVPVAFKDVT